jgi:tRNA-dihydrouridine synthase B
MKIASLTFDNNLIMAPMAGITNLPFRLLVRKFGCGLVCSEMISSNGLVYGSDKTLKMLDTATEEKPLSIQIFGSNPSIMAHAAQIVQSSGADILDINFGCSVKKILKTGSGSALMRDPHNARDILTAVRKVITIPLTIKIRTGWDRSGDQALQIARIAQDCGVDAITVHPRTASQGFTGMADWSIIAAVKKRVFIPVIGNGDITDPEHALNMIEQTSCDGVMIGRGAIRNPWIFSQINALIARRPVLPPTLDEREKLILQYMNDSVKYFGEKQACLMMRSRLCWFVKGLRNSSKFREATRHIARQDEATKIIASYIDSLKTE